MSFKYQKKKTIQIIIISFCCIALLISGIVGAMYFFRSHDNENITYGDINYNCFTEGFTDVRITDEESAIEAVGSIADVLGIKDVNKELKVVSVNNVSTDKYYRMQQYYNGIPVYGRTIVLSADKSNNATALTSNFICITDDIALEPTVTQKELEKSVQNYFDNDALTIPIDDSNLVIYQKENGGMVLCYELVVLSNRVVIDANTAEILMVTDLYVQDMVECEYKDGSFQGIKISDNYYLLGNEEKGIFVFNANYNPVIKAEVNDGKTTYISVPENSLPMTSTDNYFGNNDSFAPEEYAKAVYMLNTLQSIANYYEEINAEQNTSVIVTINDSFDPDNAFGGYDDIINVTNATIPYEKENIISIFFGQDLCNDIYGNLDTLGHEYMHGINHNFFKSDKNESSAIDEAYADIFGELLEALIKKQSPNWIHGQRNMVNPHEYDNAKYPYPASINDLENAKTFTDDDGALWYYTTANSGTDFSHFASTIISHCAYLMWNGIDGTETKKINSELLAKLWYRSLLFLQSDADFSQCRNAVELSARTMLRKNEITEEQYKTVISAFEEVGVENATFTFSKTVKNSFDLSVLSSDGTENVNYKLEVIQMPKIIIGPGIKNNQEPKTIMEKTSLEGRQHLDLKDGTYVLRLTDVSDDRNISQAINIKIVVNGNNASAADEVIINTDFTDVIVVVLNESDTPENNNTADSNDNLSINGFLSRKPFEDNKGEFAISFEYGFDTVEAWNGGTLTNFPQAMNDTFCITGDFDHDGIEDSVCSAVATDDDCTRFNFNVKTKDHVYVTDVCPSYANCDVYAYIIKGRNEDYLVRESSAKQMVEPDDDESTEDYYLYETIFVYSIKSKTSISYEFFCNKQAGGYKFTTSGWDGSGHIDDLIYQSWENSASKNQICNSKSSAIEYIKVALEKSGLSERIMGNGSTNCEIIPICAVNKMMNSENQGTAILCTNENSKPQTSGDNNDTPEEGYAGNQTAEQLRKSIIGSWGMTLDYTFDTNGICYFFGDRNHPGTYKITENKKLIIDFPWTHDEYTWSELSFDEFHEDHDFDKYFWCITSEGVLRLNGSDYYRDGRINI